MSTLNETHTKPRLNQSVIDNIPFDFSANDIEIFDCKTLLILESSLIISACAFYQILF
ncbi:hypothetical protein [Aliivibrio salmonicida]|uniref:hypothetical protein n=1 Tax=Aliivibrio salmonicida TaxID=40269 RepID=UPI0002EE838F|nr:hypothetical protein [Aliivibrio salmonicida]